jgi:serine/threonine protein kinase
MITDGAFIDAGFVELCEVILKVLDALAPIHTKGYLHLDISPDNLFISNTGLVRIIDYNSALCLNDDASDFIPSYKKRLFGKRID